MIILWIILGVVYLFFFAFFCALADRVLKVTDNYSFLFGLLWPIAGLIWLGVYCACKLIKKYEKNNK